MNAPVRITHALLKAVATAAAHQAINLGLNSPYSRANFAYRGLLNTSFNYGAFMDHKLDEPVREFDELPSHQLAFITEGFDIDPKIVKDTYEIAIKMVDLRRCVYNQDYLLHIGSAAELPEISPVIQPPTESINESQVFEPEITDPPVIEAVVKSESENNEAVEEWLKSLSVAKLPNMPKNIALALDNIGVETYADLAKLQLSELTEKLRGISGGTFHMKKCEGWLKEAKEYGTPMH